MKKLAKKLLLWVGVAICFPITIAIWIVTLTKYTYRSVKYGKIYAITTLGNEMAPLYERTDWLMDWSKK